MTGAQSWFQYVGKSKLKRWVCTERQVHTYAGSKQLDRLGIAIGDTMWAITGDFTNPNGKPILALAGRLVVDQLTSDPDKVKARARTQDIWSGICVVSKEGTEEPYKYISLADIQESLQFQSRTGAKRLDFEDRKRIGPQLLTIRLLEPESADLLEQYWSRDNLNTIRYDLSCK